MAWANQGNTYEDHDMDSSDGANARKLVVRNAAGAPSGNYRAEIIETGSGNQALNVKGITRVEPASGQTSQLSLWLFGQASLNKVNANQTAYVLQATGKVQIAPDETDVNAVMLDVHGQTNFTKSGTNAVAAKVFGDLQFNGQGTQGEVTAGKIKAAVDVSDVGQLEINAETNDPDVTIGWDSGSSGNKVTILGHGIGIGAPANPSWTANFGGDVNIQGNNVNALEVTGGIRSTQRIGTPHLNGQSGILKISTENDEQILMGNEANGSIVQIKGGVSIVGGNEHGAELTVHGQITGDAMSSNGTLNSVDDLTVGSTGTPADATIHGNLTVGTAGQGNTATINGATQCNGPLNSVDDLTVGSAQTPADATIHGDLTVGTAGQGNTATINGATQCNGPLTVGTTQLGTDTTLNGNAAVTGVLTVGTSQVPTSATVNGNISGKDVTASGKLTVTGAASLNNKLGVIGEATFSAQTNHLNGIRINPLSDSTFTGFRYQNSRIEFVVAGTLRAYIDNTGVHNA